MEFEAPDGMGVADSVKRPPIQLKEVTVTSRVVKAAGGVGTAARTGAAWIFTAGDPEPVTKTIIGLGTALYNLYVIGNEIYNYNKEHSVNSEKTVEDLLYESTPIKIKNQKKNTFYEKEGGMEQAHKEYDDLGASVEGRIPAKSGRLGKLPDGRKINVRNGSSTPGDDPTNKLPILTEVLLKLGTVNDFKR